MQGKQLGVFEAAALAFLTIGTGAFGQMRITEYQYTGGDLSSEFIEFTNVGASSIEMSGWTYDDSDATDGPRTDLSGFGTVAPGQSVVLCEATAAAFIDAWNLSGVIVIGSNPNNLGRNDTINLYDNSGTLVDNLGYGDQTYPGSVRTNGRSGFPCAQALGMNNPFGWRLSTVGDSQSSVSSDFFDVGSPGNYASFTCPPDPTGACCSAGACTTQTAQFCYGSGLYQGDGAVCSPNPCPAPSGALVRITEFMHTGTGSEFFEIRNFGASPVSLTNWHYSDESRVPGHVLLSSLGTLAAGEVAIVTEIDAADFRTDWGLAGTVKVLGLNGVNLGVQDEINIYDNSGALVDRLTYGVQNCGANPDLVSVSPCSSAVGANNEVAWRESAVGDGRGSHLSLVGDLGNPGLYTSVTCNPGSCCIDNVCSVLEQGICLNAGGLFLGDGTDCGSTPCPAADTTSVRITELMYQGTNGEFFEITNFGVSPVNLAGWSFADKCQAPGVFGIGGLGTLAPGQSAIVTDALPSTFSAAWGLSGVPVVQLASSELGRDDEIRVYNATKALVDVIHYGDQDHPGTPLTQNSSAWPAAHVVGRDQVHGWVLSTPGDAQASFASTGADVGNPGIFALVQVPAVSTWGLIALSLGVLSAGTVLAQRRQAVSKS